MVVASYLPNKTNGNLKENSIHKFSILNFYKNYIPTYKKLAKKLSTNGKHKKKLIF
jgi:hypothetical protein